MPAPNGRFPTQKHMQRILKRLHLFHMVKHFLFGLKRVGNKAISMNTGSSRGLVMKKLPTGPLETLETGTLSAPSSSFPGTWESLWYTGL